METNPNLDLSKENIVNVLNSLADPSYQKFSAHLLPPGEKVLGVRLPILRKLAKEILSNPYVKEYLSFTKKKQSIEETLLQGFVIASYPCPLKEKLTYVKRYVSHITNWSTCDSFISSLKFTKKYKKEVLSFLMPYFSSEKEYDIRFGVVMLLNYYHEKEDLEEDFLLLNPLSNKPYFARMGVAWCLSILYIKHPEETYSYLLQSHLDDTTYQKTITKILESSTIVGEERTRVLSLRKRNQPYV